MPVTINFSYARLSDLLEQTGETAWIVDLSEYKKQCRSFSRSFQQYYPASFLSHSYKTNYLETLCAAADEEGLYAEVVSAMEYELATAYGIDTSRIILNGPIKEDDLLIKALVGGSMINLDSVQEAQRLIALAERLPGTSYSVGVRCNFPLPDGAGSRFGIAVGDDDLDEVAELLSKSKKLRLTGIHCHFSAARSLQDFRWRIENMLCVSDHLFSENPPDYINLGGGFAGEMSEDLSTQFPAELPSIEEYAAEIALPMAEKYKKDDEQPSLILEPGMALLASSMVFVCRVAATKALRGRHFAVATGNIFNIKPLRSKYDLPLIRIAGIESGSEAELADWVIGGSTCMEIDILQQHYQGHLAVGDILIFTNAGAYTNVFQAPFIRPVPGIAIADENNNLSLVQRSGTSEDVLNYAYRLSTGFKS